MKLENTGKQAVKQLTVLLADGSTIEVVPEHFKIVMDQATAANSRIFPTMKAPTVFDAGYKRPTKLFFSVQCVTREIVTSSPGTDYQIVQVADGFVPEDLPADSGRKRRIIRPLQAEQEEK
ncbi:MAG: hypothetical protein GY847_01510 [Proteobacteria bacterium]|nr:hypothetical protein [Pseudomonadota bacterium]